MYVLCMYCLPVVPFRINWKNKQKNNIWSQKNETNFHDFSKTFWIWLFSSIFPGQIHELLICSSMETCNQFLSTLAYVSGGRGYFAIMASSLKIIPVIHNYLRMKKACCRLCFFWLKRLKSEFHDAHLLSTKIKQPSVLKKQLNSAFFRRWMH